MPKLGDVLAHITTTYSSYNVSEELYNSRPARVLYTSKTNTAQSGIALDDNPEQLFDYIERFLELIRAVKPKRVLLIGGGAFVLPHAINQEFPKIQLTVVEIDAELPEIAEKYFGFTRNDNTVVHTMDGLAFLEQDAQDYDLIFLDVFGESIMPPGFQTDKTAALLCRHLAKDGTVAINIIAAYHGQRSVALRRQVAALQKSFKYIQLFPAGFDESPWLPQNFILTATDRRRGLTKHLRYAPQPLPGVYELTFVGVVVSGQPPGYAPLGGRQALEHAPS